MTRTGRARLADRPCAVTVAVGLAFIFFAVGCASSGSDGGWTKDGGTDASGSGGRQGGTGGRGSGGTGTGDAGSGGISGGTGGSVGSGGSIAGSGGSTGTGSGGAGGGGADLCRTFVTQVSPAPGVPIESAPGLKIRLRGGLLAATLPTDRPVEWKWTVWRPDGTMASSPTVVNEDPSLVEFPAPQAGPYMASLVVVQSGSGTVCWGGAMTVQVSSPSAAMYKVRVIPSAESGLPVPLALDLHNPMVISLTAGSRVTIAPKLMGSNLSLIAAYVSLTSPDRFYRFETHTSRGVVSVPLLNGSPYEVFVVPTDTNLAPNLIKVAVTPFALSLDPGVYVKGHVSNVDGGHLPNARVVLRSGTLPSTFYDTDADGNFTVLAQPAATPYHVSLRPEDASGLPEVRTAGFPEPAVGPFFVSPQSALDIEFQWTLAPLATVEIGVVDGATPAKALAGASVHVRPLGAAVAGVFTITGVARTPITVNGYVGAPRAVTTDADGHAQVKLPRGRHEVTVHPPPLNTTQGTTTIVIDVSGDSSQRVTLPAVVRVTGTLLPSPITEGTTVVAEATNAYVPSGAVKAIVNSSGSFAFALDPGLVYRFIAEPPSDTALARSVMGTWRMADGTSLKAMTAQAATVVRGIVRRGGTADSDPIVPDALVEVFCAGGTVACPDRSFVVARAVSSYDGTFALKVPTTAQVARRPN